MRCCIKSCSNIGKVKKCTRESRITYYSFPKDPVIRKAWVDALSVPNWQPTDKTVICSDHFRQEDLLDTLNGARRINDWTIPSQNLEDLDAPAALRVCKICLALDAKMFHLRDCKLYNLYENITGIPQFCDDQARLPHSVCWECAARLTAAASFKTKALLSYKLLADLLKTESNIKIRDIKSINQEHKTLNSTLVIQKIFDGIDYDELKPNDRINREHNDTPHTADTEIDKKPIDINKVTIKQEGNDEVLIEGLQHFDHNAVKTEVDLVHNDITVEDRNDNCKLSVFGDGNDNTPGNEVYEKRIDYTEIQIKEENVDSVLNEEMGDELSESTSQVCTEVKASDDQIMDDDDDDMVLSELCKVIKTPDVAAAEPDNNIEEQDNPGTTRKRFQSNMESITHDSSNEDLKRKRQKYTVQSTDSSDNAKKAKGIFAVLPIEISENYSDENEKSREEKIKQQNRERSKRYRERKKMENGNKVSLSITDSSDDGRKSLEETRQKNREKSRRCRDKKRTLNLQAQNISIRQNVPYIIHTSQIPGPSKRDVAFIPPIDPNNSVFLEERIVQSQPASNLSQYVIHRSPISAGISSLKLRVQTYTAFQQNSSAHREFQKDFVENEFGHACDICDRLWFKNDLKYIPNNDTGPNIEFIRTMLLNVATLEIKICSTCFTVIKKQRIPPLSVYNGFKYPPVPENLKEFPLDLVTERLVSPRIPFMQIRRLRQVHGQLGIYGQVINIPIEVNTMANVLPRHVDDDHSVTVDIKKKKILKSSYVYSTVNKRNLKVWLQYLKDTPLYTSYGVTVDDRFLDDQNYEIDNESVFNEDGDNGILEQIPIEESLMALQQTLIWKDDMYLRMAPGEGNATNSLLFDQHAEELSFPQIYFGQFRHFRDGVTVTPFMMATSELRRSDRRGVTPQHLLYMAMNIMRIRIKESLPIASKDVGKGIEMQSDDYIQGCIESNLAFLRSIPNSDYYWAEVKRDLFAMIRQYGKPTVNFTVSANETGWPKLLQLLYNLKNNAEISADEAADLHFIEKSTLVNEDAVTCVLYFNKLVNVLLKILQSKRYSPFRKYRILNYFKRIEFQHEGSPRAHILAWLANAPEDAIGRDYKKAIDLIDFLISVSATEASGNILLQTHKHNFTCYKGIASKSPPECKFEAPFFPVKTTMILTPMEETDDRFNVYKAKYDAIRKSLEQNEYDDFESFYNENNIASDEDYVQIIRAGIKKPRVFPKREPHEKWHNPFNPFILNVAESNTDFQFITDDYSFAVYVVEYVNKTNRGVSNLQRKIIEIMDEHTEFNIFDITKNISINIFNQTEMTSQEAVWYLLREPVSKSSTIIEFIPTVWPVERQRIKKTVKELSELEDDSTDIWKENWFDKYEKRPEDIEHITLAQFVSKYYKNNKGHYVIRDEPRVIRYRNYDMATEYDEYKREMVILHLPFRDEQTEVLAEMRYLELYEENEALILERRKEFESNVDIKKILEICRDLCHENVTDGGEEIRDVGRIPDENPFDELYDNSRDEIMK